MKKWAKICAGISLIVILSSCSAMRNLSPMEVLKNSIEQPTHIQYYGESTMEVTFADTEEIDEVFVKEWRNNEMQRMEVDDGEVISTSVTNGDQSIVYNEGESVAYSFMDENNAYGLLQPKEEMDSLLGELYESHHIELVGDEMVAKRKTFHLYATPIDPNGSDSTYEIWIDKQYWVTLKMKTSNDMMNWTTTFTNIEFNPKFKENTFSMDPPKGYTLQEVDDDEQAKSISLEEAAEVYDKPFLYFEENEQFVLDTIMYSEYTDLEEEGSADEPFVDLTFNYIKNGIPYFSLTVLQPEEEPEPFPYEDDEMIHIRGQDVSFIDEAAFLSWREDGYLYMIDFYDSAITKQQIQKWTSEMVHLEK